MAGVVLATVTLSPDSAGVAGMTLPMTRGAGLALLPSRAAPEEVKSMTLWVVTRRLVESSFGSASGSSQPPVRLPR